MVNASPNFFLKKIQAELGLDSQCKQCLSNKQRS